VCKREKERGGGEGGRLEEIDKERARERERERKRERKRDRKR